MFTRILLATDGSEGAIQAAEAAAELAKKLRAHLTLLHVFQPVPLVSPYGQPLGLELTGKDIADIQAAAIQAAGTVVDRFDIPYQCRRELGHPAEAIVHVAEEEGCDLIVLGCRGLNGIQSFLLGSVSDRVMHHVHCPVLVVR